MVDEEIEALLRRGMWMGKDGPPSWALTVDQLNAVLDKLQQLGVPILGGDLYEHVGGVLRSAYMSWYSDLKADETEAEYACRSVAETREYLKSIAEIANKYLYVAVIGECRTREPVGRIPNLMDE
tara:strand:- start:320 stop:694 length:375 start_codon:yes stop_codon:yes gene_type:complete